jgi:choline dehydrogenase/4-pyridoxate dehydrogenase
VPAAERDWATLHAGLRLVREIGRESTLASFAAGEIMPGAPDCCSDREIDAHIRATAITVHHPLGSCKMGRANDPDAVVDPELRVLGVNALRVVDASVTYRRFRQGQGRTSARPEGRKSPRRA